MSAILHVNPFRLNAAVGPDSKAVLPQNRPTTPVCPLCIALSPPWHCYYSTHNHPHPLSTKQEQ